MRPFVLILAAATAFAAEPRQEARDIFKELIEINTTDSVGNNTTAAEAVARRLKQAGYADSDVTIIGPNPRKGNLVARLHGSGKGKPILFLAHLDVVEARPEDWSMPPFQFIEKDGYFYGRGTSDIKNGDTYLIEGFLRLKREGVKPDRDYILALTSDEEGGTSNGVEWLLKNHRDLIDAEYCVNTDGGGGQILNGKAAIFGVQAAEKLFFDFTLTATNPGGHSSKPTPDNAIYELAEALVKLEHYKFPVSLNEITRSYFERDAKFHDASEGAAMRALAAGKATPEQIARIEKSSYLNAEIRTTCVATLLNGGHADNALPQRATANINCRILPGQTPAQVAGVLKHLIEGTKVTLTNKTQDRTSPPSPLRPDLLHTIEKLVDGMWPGVTVMPTMDTGASDGRMLREAGIPTYGVDPTFANPDDDRAHGKDERIPVKSFYDAVEFYYRLMKAL